MTTIEQCARKKILEDVPLPPWETREPKHQMWATPDLLDWVEESEDLQNRRLGKWKLYELLWQAFSDYRCNLRPSPGDLRTMMPAGNGAWTMRPPALRIYGFVSKKRAFVAVTWAWSRDTHEKRGFGGLNDQRRDEVLTFITVHGLGGEVDPRPYEEIFPA